MKKPRFIPEGAWFWRAKLVEKGPYVGVMTWHGPPYINGEEIDRSPRYQALISNETSGRIVLFGDMTPVDVHKVMLRNLERIQLEDYLHLVDHAKWAVAHAPHLPDASPRTPINWNSGRTRF